VVVGEKATVNAAQEVVRIPRFTIGERNDFIVDAIDCIVD